MRSYLPLWKIYEKVNIHNCYICQQNSIFKYKKTVFLDRILFLRFVKLKWVIRWNKKIWKRILMTSGGLSLAPIMSIAIKRDKNTYLINLARIIAQNNAGFHITDRSNDSINFNKIHSMTTHFDLTVGPAFIWKMSIQNFSIISSLIQETKIYKISIIFCRTLFFSFFVAWLIFETWYWFSWKFNLKRISFFHNNKFLIKIYVFFPDFVNLLPMLGYLWHETCKKIF